MLLNLARPLPWGTSVAPEACQPSEAPRPQLVTAGNGEQGAASWRGSGRSPPHLSSLLMKLSSTGVSVTISAQSGRPCNHSTTTRVARHESQVTSHKSRDTWHTSHESRVLAGGCSMPGTSTGTKRDLRTLALSLGMHQYSTAGCGALHYHAVQY